MIQLSNVYVSFGKGENRISALKNISLEVERGEFLTVMGKSGCGKSTFLSLIGGIIKPTAGKYFFEGKDTAKFNDRQLAAFRNRNIGFIVQNFALVNNMTVQENIMMPLIYANVRRRDADERVYAAMEALDIEAIGKKYPPRLSGGERQRVAIARSIAADTSVILADEPTGSLDERTGRTVINIFKKLHETGKTIIMVTHDAELAHAGTRMITMKDGEIISSFSY